MISIHALVKRATRFGIAVFKGGSISIHALVKRATAAANISRHSAAISIHALVKRATADRFKPKSPANDFNPRPREEGDREEMEPKLADIISIHALVKRATGWITEALRGVSISIHALVKRATCFKL